MILRPIRVLSCRIQNTGDITLPLQSTGMRSRVVWQKFTDVSQELTASSFRVEEKTEERNKQAAVVNKDAIILLFICLLGLLYPEIGGSRLLRNVGKLLPNYTELHLTGGLITAVHRLTWLKVFVVFLSSSRQQLGQYLEKTTTVSFQFLPSS